MQNDINVIHHGSISYHRCRKVGKLAYRHCEKCLQLYAIDYTERKHKVTRELLKDNKITYLFNAAFKYAHTTCSNNVADVKVYDALNVLFPPDADEKKGLSYIRAVFSGLFRLLKERK